MVRAAIKRIVSQIPQYRRRSLLATMPPRSRRGPPLHAQADRGAVGSRRWRTTRDARGSTLCRREERPRCGALTGSPTWTRAGVHRKQARRDGGTPLERPGPRRRCTDKSQVQRQEVARGVQGGSVRVLAPRHPQEGGRERHLDVITTSAPAPRTTCTHRPPAARTPGDASTVMSHDEIAMVRTIERVIGRRYRASRCRLRLGTVALEEDGWSRAVGQTKSHMPYRRSRTRNKQTATGRNQRGCVLLVAFHYAG